MAETDLISRQAAIDAVIKRDANCGIDSAEVLKLLPSAQSDIIRCKDCDNWQYFWNLGCKKRGSCAEFSDPEDGMTRYTSEDDFCSFAERRTDD